MRGFAHVQFESVEGAQAACAKAGESLLGRPLNIDLSGSKGKSGGRGGRGGDRGGRGGRGGFGGGRGGSSFGQGKSFSIQ